MSAKIFKNAGWMVGARVFQMFIGLIISTWTVRFLGPNNIGIIGYVDAFVSFSGAIAVLGLNNILIKELLDHKDRQGSVLGTVLGMRLLASIFCAVVTTCLIAFLNPGNHLMVIVSAILFTAQLFNSFEVFNYWYQSRLQAKVSSIIQTITYVIMAVYRLYRLITYKGVLWFAAASALEPFLIGVMLYSSYRSSPDSDRLNFEPAFGLSMLTRSYHFIFSALMISIYGQMDTIMIKSFLDTQSVGWYGTALGVNAIWSFVLQAVIDSFYPAIVEAHKSDREMYERRIVQLYSLVFWMSVCASALITVLAKPIILILYGAEYAPSIACLRVCTWINTFAFLGVARGAWMVCENNQVYQKYILAEGAAVNLILNYFWIQKFGMVGAAWATVVTQIITSTIGPLTFARTRINTYYILRALNPAVVLDLFGSVLKQRRGKA